MQQLIPDSWKPAWEALSVEYHSKQIVHYAIRIGKEPSEFTDADLDAWSQESVRSGRSLPVVRSSRSRLLSKLLASGLKPAFPRITFPSKLTSQYSVGMEAFPLTLRSEVEALLEWKQAAFAPGRPSRSRIRAVTANNLLVCIQGLYGFATRVEKRIGVDSLISLVTEETVVAFVKFSLITRHMNGSSVSVRLGLLYAALRHNPAYKEQDFSWLRSVLSQIPRDSESERRERKSKKYVPYDVLKMIPHRIHEERKEVQKRGNHALAELVHDELLISFLSTLAWRQRNIRGFYLGLNLFRATVPLYGNIAVPDWAQEKLKTNPHEQFWQIYFRETETKTKHEVREILPLRLVALLEEYLEQHRPLLVSNSATETLFVNRRGGGMTQSQVTELVAKLTVKYTGRIVTPHIFRDIFAFAWLAEHPEDYLTLSKMLWHKDINTTLRIYGGKFNESYALKRVEEWLDAASHNQIAS